MLDAWMTWAQSGTVIRRFSAGLALVLALSVATAAGSSSRTAAFAGKNGKILFPAGEDLGTNTERNRGFYTITARGTRLRQLLKEPASEVRWSPDGREILFSSRCGITFATATGTNRTCLGVSRCRRFRSQLVVRRIANRPRKKSAGRRPHASDSDSRRVPLDDASDQGWFSV
jgi:hypothetical protein